ncbi:protein CitXG [Propionigenium maris DSM 9537]|uniref:Protein CitXG n=1 Tax=Propionigenium maris DSM 9537 TaxID=1123000 RepID=A0A9W6LP99_9FUSO|nr:triphosphoribosyl-dephospho-CoA synthase [Propionigenium maris]GLI57498.1 protein CitXG [Propionigenium maris DSM 9537]
MDIREKILLDRENRVNLVRERLSSNNLILTLKVNIVGNDKNIDGTKAILDYFYKKIEETFDINSTEFIDSFDGNYYIIELPRLDYVETKRKLIGLEETTLGRLVDIDLFSDMKKSVSRIDLGLEPRRCIVCGRLYNTCLRERAHTLEEVLIKTKELIREGLVEVLLKFTTDSIVEEVSAHPKFGLVTKECSGSHRDMDYDTFIRSKEALTESMERYLYTGFEIDEDTLPRLRGIGLEAEKEMFKSTGGVNTHKGAVFLLGFLLPSLTNVLYYDKEIDSICHIVGELGKSILKDFEGLEGKEDLTYGERIYLDHGITGVRGVVFEGFKVLTDNIHEIVESSELEGNENVLRLLLLFMREIDDTTLLHRHPVEILREVKEVSHECYRDNKLDYDKINEITEVFIKRRISPGGSADMVILALILQKVIKNFGKEWILNV